jgi:hypothetical protein
MTSEHKLQTADELGRALLRYTEYASEAFPFGVPKTLPATGLRLLAVAANVQESDHTLFSSIVAQGLKWPSQEASLHSSELTADAINSLVLGHKPKTLLVFGGSLELGKQLNAAVHCFMAPTLAEIRSDAGVKKRFWGDFKAHLEKKL